MAPGKPVRNWAFAPEKTIPPVREAARVAIFLTPAPASFLLPCMGLFFKFLNE